ncbi:MAG TPA: hypothetical protein VF131_17780 [Blastocatellia bacterium]|nr:hypothetical protein [Blastocatellia bacterium]
MKNKSNSTLIAGYIAFEQTINLKNCDLSGYSHLSRFNGNKSKAIHRWFTYKEGFSSELLSWASGQIGLELDGMNAILDPFCGVGTSLLSAQMTYRGDHQLLAVGVERNPFIAFVARTKLNWPYYKANRIKRLIPKLVGAIETRPRAKYELAELSTIQNQEVFNRRKLYDMLYARDLIQSELNNTPEHDFFLLGWSSIIEEVSNLRKDGRALRFVEKETRAPVHKLLKQKWESMLGDLVQLNSKAFGEIGNKVTHKILEGDGRRLEGIDNISKMYNLIIYSPPYLNNIDYSEVYKLELWLCGFVKKQVDFRNLRMSTLRSHPSIKFPETDFVDKLPSTCWPKRLRESLIAAIPQDEDYNWRVRLVRAYMDDLLVSLQRQYQAIESGGFVICVVGNSLHGGKGNNIPIATDLLISAMGRVVGFKVEQLRVTRQLSRRANNDHLLRESIIIMRRP